MSTLLLSQNYAPMNGGSARWFSHLYPRLKNHQYIVATDHNPLASSFDPSHPLPIHRTPMHFADWGLLSLPAYRQYRSISLWLDQLVTHHNVQSVHVGRCLPEGWLALGLKRKRGLEYACYVHGEELNTVSTSRQLGWMTRRVFNHAAMIIANSHHTRSLLEQHWVNDPRRIVVMHPGVDIRLFKPGCDPAFRDHHRWTGKKILLTVSRLQARKGHDRMIQAVNLIRNQIPDILYAIAGEGEQRPNLLAKVQQLHLQNHVQFLGSLDDADMIRALRNCDLFVLPNRQVQGDFEGFGMVLLEAQACARTVVAGASGGTAETMHPGITGQLVDADNIHQLAHTVATLLNDDSRRNTMAHAARLWVENHFSFDRLAQHADSLFANLHKPHPAPAHDTATHTV